MVKSRLDWTEFKTRCNDKGMLMQYTETDTTYDLFAFDGQLKYYCYIDKDDTPNADQTDFETNFKADSNKPVIIRNVEGKQSVVSSSRPVGTKTVFTMRGDHATNGIGKGTIAEWDFSNSDNDVTADTGRTRKEIDITFNEDVWIKEGTLYFHNAKKTTYGELDVVCPAGGYIQHPTMGLIQVPVDTVVSKYVMHHLIQGDCPMGDELNTEEAQENAIPAGYKIRIRIDAPDTDIDSNGYVSFELYRVNTV